METIEQPSLWDDLVCPVLTIWGGWIWFLAAFCTVLYIMVDNGITGLWRYGTPLIGGFLIVSAIWIVC